MTRFHRRLRTDKFIGFDIDHTHTPAFCVQAGRYRKLRTDVGQLLQWLKTQRGPGNRRHRTFVAHGMSGHLYDGLVDVVDDATNRSNRHSLSLNVNVIAARTGRHAGV